MKHPALKELYNIMKIEDWTDFCPEKERTELLDQWIEKWVMEVEESQFVVSPKYLSADYSDAIKFKLAQNMAELLAEECTSYSTSDKKIAASMVALRRRSK